MRVGIFYFSTEPGEDRQQVLDRGGVFPIGYVRCEVVDLAGSSEESALEKALDMANPRPHESVMNTHPLK